MEPTGEVEERRPWNCWRRSMEGEEDRGRLQTTYAPARET